jgi:hypothetical protein
MHNPPIFCDRNFRNLISSNRRNWKVTDLDNQYPLPSIEKRAQGPSVSSDGFIVYWKSLDGQDAWDQILESELDMEHYVKIYTSAIINQHKQEQTETHDAFIGKVLNCIGQLHLEG